ncbi:nucleotidyltransferase family protein [bacterium]|jgi:glucose-1-phosphate thymidylyltransferase|nr:nucleotidyltransferase family protein [bacterium]MBT6831491.1 nucleotidyltransferase family protein [bacterium]MBT6996045.1 nucleotidyltransferase family protein [bacterium]MBT7772166.1 nucleotidyltransferase family protein [bacterium]
MKALILAGGFATRLWPLSEKHAKPLLLLDGKTILAHILEKLPNDISTVLLTNSKFAADFETELQKIGRKNVSVFCEDSHSDGEKLGALGAISAAIETFQIDENILILAGDNLLPELLIEQLFCSENESKIAVREVSNLHEAKKFGVVERDGKRVVGFEEKPENPKSKLVLTGFFSLGKNLLPILCDFSKKFPDALGGIFPELLRKNFQISAVPVGGEWFDIGSFETYLDAHKKLQKKSVSRGKNVSEFKNTFSGKNFLGDGATVKNCHLHDTIVYPGARLENCIISRSVIDQNCDLSGLDLNQKLVRAGTKVRAER